MRDMHGDRVVKLLGSWMERRGPIYQRLARAFEQAIRNGELPPETRLPAERWLARQLGISRNTVVAAYTHLQEAGWVERLRGSGTRVSSLSAHRSRLLHLGQIEPIGHGPVIDAYLQAQSDLIDLSTGAPAWPSGLDAELCTLSPQETDLCLTEYGYAPRGLPPLRRALARWHTQAGQPTEPDQIITTGGAQQAISLLAQLLLQRGDTVLIENPTFFGAIDAFRAAGARLGPVAVGTHTFDLDGLEERMADQRAQCVYLIPTFHNPTGHVLDEAERRRIVHLGERWKIPIIEDLTMAHSVVDCEPPPPLATYGAGAPIITIGSLSKLFWAGLRVGWIRADASIIERLARLKAIADLGSSIVSQLIALHLIPEIGRVKALRRVELSERRDALLACLRRHAPRWEWACPPGGLFVWVRVPGCDTRVLMHEALRAQVRITPGTLLSVDESHHEYLRIPFLLPVPRLEAGSMRLIETWRGVRTSPDAIPAPSTL